MTALAYILLVALIVAAGVVIALATLLLMDACPRHKLYAPPPRRSAATARSEPIRRRKGHTWQS